MKIPAHNFLPSIFRSLRSQIPNIIVIIPAEEITMLTFEISPVRRAKRYM